MIPRTLSASSLDVADKCLARWRDEYFLRGANIQGTAANVGIVCHGAFEDMLRAVFIRKDHGWEEEKFWEYFHKHSDAVLGANRTSAEYEDAKTLCDKWFHRKGRYDELAAVEILSLESKSSFPLKTQAGEIPFNYIMDRMERIGPGEYRVVDYKSNRVGLSENQLRRKLQARLYALMVQIKYKDAQRIWVQFDFLRHGPIEVLFTREDNVVMYRELQRRANDIINTPENRAPETINEDCTWCVRKPACKKLTSHINVGGIMSLDPDQLADLHYKLANQLKAAEGLKAQIEERLLAYAINEDLLEFETNTGTVTVTASAKRQIVDHDVVAAILGPLAGDIRKFSVTDLDRVIKNGQVTPQQAELLKLNMKKKLGDPTVKVEHSKY